ncbi:MAG: 16S rRNA (uracil(1498)-N(3))-methyltransferase [Treponema sp.]|jgi:RsmE family RNA methyltransferase|nr:16S rRNA (uracil(1498)-N(3))-methyltransferase [Treponema sp.]
MNVILFEPHEAGAPLKKRDERTIHLLKVLRKKAGDEFDAGILGGRLGTGRIQSIDAEGSLEYTLDLREDPPPRLPLRMVVGFPRPIQLRRLLRDLSNLGLEAVDLLGTDLGEKSYRDTRLLSDGGARTALIEGAVQGRDTGLPVLRVFADVRSWLAERPWETVPEPALIAADNVRPQGTFAGIATERRPMVIAAGSERGWSDRERDLLEAAGFLRLSLGKRALRTETACVAAAALAMEKIGELG